MAASTVVPTGQGWSKALPYLAVGRVKDATNLASLSLHETDQQREKTEEIFKKLLTAARQKLKPGQRTRLMWNEGSVCCLMDQQGNLLLCVVTSFMEYPERHAYQLLSEFLGSVVELDYDTTPENGLSKKLEGRMQELLTKYEDPTTFDQVSQTLDKVNVVKSVMQDNLRQVQDTGRGLQDLQARSQLVAQHSTMFNDTSRDLRSVYQWRRWKLWILCGVVLLLLILLIVWKARG